MSSAETLVSAPTGRYRLERPLGAGGLSSTLPAARGESLRDRLSRVVRQ